MSNSQNGSADDLDSPQNLLAMKDALYGRYQKGHDWEAKLSRQLAHKALDIPVDDMQITVNKGVGLWGMVLMALTTLGGFALLGWYVHDAKRPEPPPPAAEEREFEVRFYDAQGRPIQVPRLPEGTSGE